MEPIKIDGRNWHGITDALSARQDDWILSQLRRSGAMDVLVLMAKDASKEDRGAAGMEMFERIRESGRKFKLLAGLLTEEGKTWTHDSAEKNALRFSEITATEDKLAMNDELMRHVAYFSTFGAGFSTTSPNSLNQKKTVPATENAGVEISATSAP